MRFTKNTCLVVAILITTIVCIFILFSKQEDYSYHFGFPTWGSINNSGYTGWGGVRLNPFMIHSRYPYYFGGHVPYHPHGFPRSYYYRTSVKPYLSRRCYSSSRAEDCLPGYRKISLDDNDDGKLEFKCCRRI